MNKKPFYFKFYVDQDHIEVKKLEGEKTSVFIEGYASTPGIDRYQDIVEPGAFVESLKNYLEKNPIVLLQHNTDKPIGKVLTAEINENGLKVRCEITANTDEVQDRIREGVLRCFSIGYRPMSWEWRLVGDSEVRAITKLELVEISIVSIPANADGLFTMDMSVKSFFSNFEKKSSEDEESVDVDGSPSNTETISAIASSTDESQDASDTTSVESTDPDESTGDATTDDADTTESKSFDQNEIKALREANSTLTQDLTAAREELKDAQKLVNDLYRRLSAPIYKAVATLSPPSPKESQKSDGSLLDLIREANNKS